VNLKEGEGLSRRPRGRFQVTDELRQRLAFWRGNTAAVHRELAAAAKAGDRAGLAGGEHARRAYDVFLQRPGTHRNAVWEADQVDQGLACVQVADHECRD
jgi:putative transposase